MIIDFILLTSGFDNPGATMLDDFPEELSGMVHDFWKQFPPQHPFFRHTVGILFFILWILSFFGNGCVLYIFTVAKPLRTPVSHNQLDLLLTMNALQTNIFVLNLALSDLIMFTTHGLPMCLNMFLSDHWIYGVLGCQLYACLGGICGNKPLMYTLLI